MKIFVDITVVCAFAPCCQVQFKYIEGAYWLIFHNFFNVNFCIISWANLAFYGAVRLTVKIAPRVFFLLVFDNFVTFLCQPAFLGFPVISSTEKREPWEVELSVTPLHSRLLLIVYELAWSVLSVAADVSKKLSKYMKTFSQTNKKLNASGMVRRAMAGHRGQK